MARSKTQNIPDLRALLEPGNQVTLAVERALLRGQEWAHASVPVAEQIAARLAGAITLNLVKAGQRLLESDISAVLHVSRAPVREALRILERDQLVAFQARRGAVVAAPDANEIRDIFAVRRTLYGVLLRQVMRDRPADLEALLATRVPALTRSTEVSVDAYAVEAFLLNMEMDDLAANRLLSDMLKSIGLRTLRYVRIGLAANPRDLTGRVRSWRSLQRAVSRRDVDEVLEVTAKRLDNVHDAVIAAVSDQDVAAAPAASTPSTREKAAVKAASNANRQRRGSRASTSRH